MILGVKGREGRMIKRDGIRDKAFKSRIISFSFISLSHQVEGEGKG